MHVHNHLLYRPTILHCVYKTTFTLVFPIFTYASHPTWSLKIAKLFMYMNNVNNQMGIKPMQAILQFYFLMIYFRQRRHNCTIGVSTQYRLTKNGQF